MFRDSQSSAGSSLGGICLTRNRENPEIAGFFIRIAVPTIVASIFNKLVDIRNLESISSQATCRATVGHFESLETGTRLKGNPERDTAATDRPSLRAPRSQPQWGYHSYARIEFREGFTVVMLGPIFDFDTSGKFFELVKPNRYAPRLATMSNVMSLPGAVAFKSRNAIVGALGVGGAPGEDKDGVCAQAGVAKVADKLSN